jgi:HAD superfamily hydrolase (TIGR01509 family)
MRPIQLVCFDLGGVVVRICRSFEEACAAAQLPVRPARFDGIDELTRRYQVGELTHEQFAHALALDMGTYAPEEILAIHRAWLLDAYAGVPELVDELHEIGLATAVLSNTNSGHWATLVELPAVRRIRHLFASHLIGALKPARGAYEHVERATGVRGEAVVFFDDTAENVHAAHGLGWRAALIAPERDPAAQMRAALRELGVLS